MSEQSLRVSARPADPQTEVVRFDREAPDPRGALELEYYFPTMIFFRDLPDGVMLNRGVLADIRTWRAQDPQGIHRSNMKQAGSWHSGLDMNHRPALAALTERIRDTLREVGLQFGYDPAWPLDISNMWANVNPRHGYNRNHIHPNALWSGVYYVQAPPHCGRIIFSDPRAANLMTAARFDPKHERQAESWTEVFFEAIEGRLILFPAWLYHEVEANLTEVEGPTGDRISISFNTYQKAASD